MPQVLVPIGLSQVSSASQVINVAPHPVAVVSQFSTARCSASFRVRRVASSRWFPRQVLQDSSSRVRVCGPALSHKRVASIISSAFCDSSPPLSWEVRGMVSSPRATVRHLLCRLRHRDLSTCADLHSLCHSLAISATTSSTNSCCDVTRFGKDDDVCRMLSSSFSENDYCVSPTQHTSGDLSLAIKACFKYARAS